MKFLSLSRPWDWAIFDPIAAKGIENRSWQPPIAMIGQQIALQSAKSWDPDALHFFRALGIDHFPMTYHHYPSGIIRGVVTIERVVTKSDTLPPEQQRWFFGEYGWVLSHIIRFPRFVSCKGAQGLRNLPTDVEPLVQAAIREAA